MRHRLRRLAVLLLALAAVGCGTAAPGGGAPAVSFSGKTITVIVNYTAGGPTDLDARIYARFMPQFLPGHPTVIVKNVPGAGGMIGWNQVYNQAKPDGLTMCVCTDPTSAVLVGDPGVKFDPTKFVWVGAEPYTDFLYVSPTTGVKQPSDLLHPKQPLVFGGLGSSSSIDLVTKLLFQALKVPLKVVTGYPGLAQVKQAFLAHEITVGTVAISTWSSLGYPSLEQGGEVVRLAQSGIFGPGGKIVPDPRSDLPTFPEAIQQATGQPPTGTAYDAMQLIIAGFNAYRAIALPPGTPAATADAITQGLVAMFQDADFKAAFKKTNGVDAVLSPGHDVTDALNTQAQLAREHPDASSLLKQLAAVKPQ